MGKLWITSILIKHIDTLKKFTVASYTIWIKDVRIVPSGTRDE